MTSIKWGAESSLEGDVRQRLCHVRRDGAASPVPAVLWTPSEVGEPLPLALIGHGGGGHKVDESRTDLAARYVLGHGLAAAAIDGPAHGERKPPPGSEGPGYGPEVAASMVADWRATIEALALLPEIDAGRIGYGGVSMGTMFGLPLVAAEPRIRAAVLGLCGLTHEGGGRPPLSDMLEDAAPRVRCPTLFLVQWDDELFPREGVLALFDLLGTEDKRLLAYPGPHHGAPPEVREISTGFLAERLLTLER